MSRPLTNEELDEICVLNTRWHRGVMDAAELKDNAALLMKAVEELIEIRTNKKC